MLAKKIAMILSICLMLSFSVIFVNAEEKPDPVNFPNEEVELAENIWNSFAYSKSYGVFSPKYLSVGLLPDETPEIYWYYSYFIDFCKEKDLLSYEPIGDFSQYELIMKDFEKYYLEHSEYLKPDWGGNSWTIKSTTLKITINDSELPVEYEFAKNGENWEIQELTLQGAFWERISDPEIYQIITPIAKNPFDIYKTVETTTEITTETTTVTSSNNTIETPDKKDFPIFALALIGGLVLVVGVVVIFLKKKK